MTAPAQQRLAADPDAMQTWLTHLFAHAGDGQHIGIAGGWGDRLENNFFPANAKGIEAAVRYAIQLDRREPQGIYAQSTTVLELPPAGKRGGEAIVSGLTHLWSDGDCGTIGHKPGPDDLPAPPNTDAIEKVHSESGLPEPSGWSLSGGGYNSLWLLTETHYITGEDDRARVKQLTMDWQTILGAAAHRNGWSWDVGVGNLDRLMKLPGSINRKEGLERPTGIGPGTGALYTLDELYEIRDRLIPDSRKVMAQAAKEKRERQAARTGRKLPLPRPPKTSTATRRSGDGPLDVLAEMMQFRDILEPEGFTYEGQHSDGREKWLRPAANGDRASSAYSLLCDDHVAVNWSERSDLPVGAQPAGQKLTIGTLYAYLNYGGDVSEAARDIMRAAAGRGAHGPAGRLPTEVLDAVRQRCLPEPEAAPPVPPQGDDIDWADIDTAEATQESKSAQRAAPRGLLPPEFYEARLAHRRIRQAAHAINRSADVAFAGVLARLSSLMPPDRPADTGVGSPASMNTFVALLGPSGSGKSSSKRVPRFLVPIPSGLDIAEYLPLGTGEGIAEAYMGEIDVSDGGRGKPKVIREQVRGNALIYADEGERLIKTMFGRTGTTIGETLRTAWTGDTIGQFNGQKVNTRVIEEGTYSLGMIIGFQPETALPLFDDAAAGTPQRFLWFSTLDTTLPDNPPDWPKPLELPLLDTKLRGVQITFADTIRKELRADDRARVTGEITSAPLDSHKPLSLVKTAVLLAILDNRADVSTEDWDLARIVWDTSCQVRDGLVEQAARQRAKEEEQRTKQHVDRAVRAHKAVSSADRNVERVARRIANRVHESGGMTVGAARKDLASRDRGFLSDALDYAEAQGWTDHDGDKIAPGGSKPT